MKTISCVMVTRKRFELWKRSVNAFLEQDYPYRQLVVIVDRDPEGFLLMKQYLEAHNIDDVVLHSSAEALPLGALRNSSIERADGEIVCQWDDDDLYHPERLTRQLAAMLDANAQVSYLEEYLTFCDATSYLYWCDYYRTGLPGMPSTLLGYKAALPSYSEVRIHEDTLLQRAMVLGERRICSVRGLAGLHIYVAHGQNTSSTRHMQGLWRSIGREASSIRERRSELEVWLGSYAALPDLTVRSYQDEEVFRFAAPAAAMA